MRGILQAFYSACSHGFYAAQETRTNVFAYVTWTNPLPEMLQKPRCKCIAFCQKYFPRLCAFCALTFYKSLCLY